jgi:hypothetical protein
VRSVYECDCKDGRRTTESQPRTAHSGHLSRSALHGLWTMQCGSEELAKREKRARRGEARCTTRPWVVGCWLLWAPDWLPALVAGQCDSPAPPIKPPHRPRAPQHQLPVSQNSSAPAHRPLADVRHQTPAPPPRCPQPQFLSSELKNAISRSTYAHIYITIQIYIYIYERIDGLPADGGACRGGFCNARAQRIRGLLSLLLMGAGCQCQCYRRQRTRLPCHRSARAKFWT